MPVVRIISDNKSKRELVITQFPFSAPLSNYIPIYPSVLKAFFTKGTEQIELHDAPRQTLFVCALDYVGHCHAYNVSNVRDRDRDNLERSRIRGRKVLDDKGFFPGQTNSGTIDTYVEWEEIVPK